MNNVKVFTSDRLNASDRFRRTVRAMAQQRSLDVQHLYDDAPRLVWTGPDPNFQERIRTAEIITRAYIGDLNQVTAKITMLTTFETILRNYDAVVQPELDTAWELGFRAAGGTDYAPDHPDAIKLEALRQACRIPDTFGIAIQEHQVLLASLWQAWSDFVRTTWHLKPEEPIQAWFPAGTDEVFTLIRTNSAAPQTALVTELRQPFDVMWQTTLANIAASGIGGEASGSRD